MSAEESIPVINHLKQINSLKTELIRFKLIAKSYQKYFDYFNEFNETIDSNEDLLNLKNEIIALKEDQNLCFVSVEKLSENQLNQMKFQTDVSKTYVKTRNISTQTEITETNHKFRDKKVFNQTEENGFEYNGSNIRIYAKKEEIQYKNCFTIKNNRSLRTNRKRKHNSISSASEENYIEFSDKSDTDYNYESNDEQMSDSSDYENELKNTFRCVVKGCSYSGRTKNDLLRHKREMHSNKTQDSNGVFVCEHIGCKKRFNNKCYLKSHQKTHSGGEYKCEWEDCTSVFLLKKYLHRHMNRHKGKYRCTHEGCSFSGSKGYDLKKHEMTHSEDRQLKCLIGGCNKLFKSDLGFQNHQLRAHPQEFDDIPWFECIQNDCNFKTKLKPYFDLHLKQHIRPFNCDECQKSFATRHGLAIHMSTHSSELKIRCDWPGCDQLFATKQTMSDHMNRHTLEISHSCYWPSCGKTFTTKKGLDSHIRVHKGLVEHHCPHCDYKNTRLHRLRNHMKRKHENQKIESIEIELINNSSTVSLE